MSLRKSSNSSRQLREHLKQHFVIVPPLVKTVPLTRYIALCKIVFENALEKFKKNSYRDISACRSAYVDFYKFQILALERIPSHADYKDMDPSTKRFDLYNYMNICSRSTKAAMTYLEDIVVMLDEEEDINQQQQMEQALIDEFDGDSTIERSSAVVQSSSPSFLGNQSLVQSTAMPASTVPVLFLSPETKSSAVDKNNLQHRLATLLGNPPPGQQLGNNVTSEPVLYDIAAPSITYLSLPTSPSSNDRVIAIATALDDDVVINGLVGVFPSDIQIARLTLQYTKFSTPPPATGTILIQIGKVFGCNFYVYDYQVSFAGFLQHVPFDLQMTRSAIETNRCFFLHLGIAVGIHPFILQMAFRYNAAKIMRKCEDWVRDIVSSVTEYAGFVDANALSFIWPEEFSGIRICIVSGRLNSPILSIFHQDSISPSSAQFKDVYIRCDGSHFTLLRPFSNDGSFMDQIASVAAANGLVVQRHAIGSGATKSLLSVNEAINELLLLA